MKNPFQEQRRVQARQYHLNHPWNLEKGGIHARHVFEPEKTLSWWSDYGFVQSGRRVMIWWVHPRMKYADALTERAWEEVGPEPAEPNGMFDTEPQWRKVGRSRKKIWYERSKPLSESWNKYYDHVTEITTRIGNEGIDLDIAPTMFVQNFSWCTGVDLCVPMEVRNSNEALKLVKLARQLLKRETTLTAAFPQYRYGRGEWLSEASVRKEDQDLSGSVN